MRIETKQEHLFCFWSCLLLQGAQERDMLTAIINGETTAFALARTFAPLVPGVIEGLLSDVIVVVRPDDHEAATVARAAGADIIEADDWPTGFRDATARARTGTLLVIDGGVIIGESFWAIVADRLRAGMPDGVLATRPENNGFCSKLANRLLGRAGRDQALILPAGLADGDPWAQRWGRRLTVLPTGSIRLKG